MMRTAQETRDEMKRLGAKGAPAKLIERCLGHIAEEIEKAMKWGMHCAIVDFGTLGELAQCDSDVIARSANPDDTPLWRVLKERVEAKGYVVRRGPDFTGVHGFIVDWKHPKEADCPAERDADGDPW